MWKPWNPSKGASCGASFDALLRLSDEELFVHVQHEDGDAIAILYERYRRLVRRIALQVLGDEGEAEDTVQSRAKTSVLSLWFHIDSAQSPIILAKQSVPHFS